MKKINKKNRMKWLNYKLDNYISKGVRAQFVLLFCAIMLFVLCFGIVAGLLSPEMTVGSALWQALIHIIDQGTIGGDDPSEVAYVAIMLLVTFLGMAFTGTIVGIINNAMSEKLDELKKGHSQIIEEGHVVVIGFDENVYTLISQMDESNKNWTGNKKIVVIDGMPKEEMEQLAGEHEQTLTGFGKDGFKKSRKEKNHTIYRSGSIVSENTYTMASIEKARAIIINEGDDFTVIRVMLALSSYLKKHNAYNKANMPAIVSLMHEKENITAAEIAAGIDHDKANTVGKSDGSKVRVLYFEDILAHIFAHVCRQPGLSWVVSEIFDYDDSEIYIESEKKGGISLDADFSGKTFGEISEMMTNSIALGIQHGREINLNPDPKNTIFEKGDKIIHLAEDDSQIVLAKDIDKEAMYVTGKSTAIKHDPYNLLVFGWSVPLPEIIKDIDKYALGGGTVRILTRHECDAEETFVCPYQKTKHSKKVVRGVADIGVLKHLEIIPEEPIDPYDWELVSAHLNEEKVWEENLPTNILILCQDGIDKVEADEKAAVLLLNIRQFLSKKGLDKKINITTEMNLPENQQLLHHASVNDFIVGSEIANRMMVQVANNPDIESVFIELLNDQGSELYLKNIDEYIDPSVSFTFKAIERAARSKVDLGTGRQEIALGWIRIDDSLEEPEVKLNPSGADRFEKFNVIGDPRENYKLIVLAKNNEA